VEEREDSVRYTAILVVDGKVEGEVRFSHPKPFLTKGEMRSKADGFYFGYVYGPGFPSGGYPAARVAFESSANNFDVFSREAGCNAAGIPDLWKEVPLPV
jgi:hypothetical protein